MSLINPFTMPGMGDPTETNEYEFTFGPAERRLTTPVILSSAAVDAGATPTTKLRKGLLLGKVTTGGEYKEYDPTATDGSQFAVGVLLIGVNMLDLASGTAVDRQGVMVIGGCLKASQVHGLDYNARRHLGHRFIFDDDLLGQHTAQGYPLVQAVTADATLTAADNNKLFTNRAAAGAVVVTLPALARGLRFKFYVEAGQNVTIASAAADTLVAFNDLAADSVALSTAGELIGGCFEVIANPDATKWLVVPHLWEGQTMTIAT